MASWRDPVKLVGVEESEDEILLMADGTFRSAPHVILTERDTGRVRGGYVCIKCYEPHEHAFPDKCSLCGFPMRERQAERFAKEFKGATRVGPSTTIDEEMQIAEEWVRERRLREQGLKTTQSGIVVPSGF